MFIKRLIYRLIHDALYDWYQEVKPGKESILDFIIHWGTWVGAFIFAHVFWGIVIYLAFIFELQFYQFMLIIIFLLTFYFLLWYFVDKYYDGDRPTISGVNDKWIK
ncbi:MAG: hypothetical protein QXP66_01820 [Candidatus Aenigmatarchaeota archaeon]